MNHIYLNIVPIRSFDTAFLTLSSGTSFISAMTKPVVVISVGRKLLQKFSVWFLLADFVSWCSCQLSIMWSLSTIKKNSTTEWNAFKPDLSCRNLWCFGHRLYGSFPMSHGYRYILVVVDYVSKWIEVIACRFNDHKVVINFLKENVFFSFWLSSCNH